MLLDQQNTLKHAVCQQNTLKHAVCQQNTPKHVVGPTKHNEIRCCASKTLKHTVRPVKHTKTRSWIDETIHAVLTKEAAEPARQSPRQSSSSQTDETQPCQQKNHFDFLIESYQTSKISLSLSLSLSVSLCDFSVLLSLLGPCCLPLNNS